MVKLIYNVIPVIFGTYRTVKAPNINYQYDVKQVIQIIGLKLPEHYIVDFCNEGDTHTISMPNVDNEIEVPDELLINGKTIKAYIVLTKDDSTQTRYEITIPVNNRPERSDIQPTPSQQLVIDELVEAMNNTIEKSEEAVLHYPKIVNGYWYAYDTETGTWANTNIKAQGPKGDVGAKGDKGDPGGGFVYFEIRYPGYLMMTRSDNLDDDIDFALTDEGDLEVTLR